MEEGSPASLAGLQPGDLIVEADRRKVANAGDLQEALDKAKDKDTVLLLVKRKSAQPVRGAALEITVPRPAGL